MKHEMIDKKVPGTTFSFLEQSTGHPDPPASRKGATSPSASSPRGKPASSPQRSKMGTTGVSIVTDKSGSGNGSGNKKKSNHVVIYWTDHEVFLVF